MTKQQSWVVAVVLAMTGVIAWACGESTTPTPNGDGGGGTNGDGSTSTPSDSAASDSPTGAGNGAECAVSSECQSKCCQLAGGGDRRGFCQPLAFTFDQRCACAANAECGGMRTCLGKDDPQCETFADANEPRYCQRACD